MKLPSCGAGIINSGGGSVSWHASLPVAHADNAVHDRAMTQTLDWMHYPDCIPAFVERLQGVVIENKDALEVIAQHDDVDTLTYCAAPRTS